MSIDVTLRDISYRLSALEAANSDLSQPPSYNFDDVNDLINDIRNALLSCPPSAKIKELIQAQALSERAHLLSQRLGQEPEKIVALMKSIQI